MIIYGKQNQNQTPITEEETHLFERDHSHQASHARHIGVIQPQQGEDSVSLWRGRAGSRPGYRLSGRWGHLNLDQSFANGGNWHQTAWR